MAGMVQPDPKNQDDDPHPMAPPAANQTTAAGLRDAFARATPQGMMINNLLVPAMKQATQHYADGSPNVQPELPAAAANDPGFAARLALHNRLNPGNGTVTDFPIQPGPAAARAAGLPETPVSPAGAPTPLAPQIPFAPPLPLNVAHAKAIYDNAVGATTAQPPGTQGGRTAAPGGQPVSGPMQSFDNGNVQMSPGPISYVAPAGPQFGSPGHALSAPHEYTQDQFVTALANTPRSVVDRMLTLAHPRSMQAQAAGLALSNAIHQGDEKTVSRILQIIYGSGTALPGYFDQGQ